MDQLTHHLLGKEVIKFIDSIDPTLACELATFLHPEKKLCRVSSEPTKGSLQYLLSYSLTDVPHLSDDLLLQLFDQLADIYIQLCHSKFDYVGALTLDDNDENWVFGQNRLLTIELNDQELSGMKSSEIIPASQTYSSTVDYVYAILKLGIVMDWVKRKDKHGPFILMYGDLRPPNIFVDDDLNIVSVIDWEWSHTIPPQMFLPPS
ncbi:hypothetical protein ACJ72_06802 [Emergomyces africanus]|uniref:Aminoglycoside phosphotransferase domain-containing protein n=1 Tax=Emergomyces africanus TaxID=1955775 RepID=A0A1B7NPY2_9EURO|nr:hypothetical protein ACJ72_06802 [Emergomyces africanus]